jgi:hypothetical protein
MWRELRLVQQVVYASLAAGALPAREIERILEQARRGNQKRDITGFLLFDGAQFLQLLEGDKSDVSELFEIIRRDPRHRDVQPMLAQDGAHRCFSNWSMAYAIARPGSIRKIDGSMSSSGAREMVGYLRTSHSELSGVIADFLSDLLDEPSLNRSACAS